MSGPIYVPHYPPKSRWRQIKRVLKDIALVPLGFAMLALIGLVIAFLTLGVEAAFGSNVATPKMREVASWAAGKPIDVWCEGDLGDWQRMTAAIGEPPTLGGYTFLSRPEIFLHPYACAWLLQGGRGFGPSLHILLHESAHQRLMSVNEAEVDCYARSLVQPALILWGLSAPRVRAIHSWLALLFARSAPPEYQGAC